MKNLFYKATIIATIGMMAGSDSALAQTIRLRKPTPALSHIFHMGQKANPAGETLDIDSKGILYNGKPQIPVMGEFHYNFPNL